MLALAGGDVAVYGEDGGAVEFPGTSCVVVVPHVAVNCTTSPGAGYGLNWIMSVGGQTSQSPVTAYMPPTITATAVVPGMSDCQCAAN